MTRATQSRQRVPRDRTQSPHRKPPGKDAMIATATTERAERSQRCEPASSAARRVTDVLEPRSWVIALVIGLGWKADGPAGVGWGLVAGLFAAIFPVMFVRYGIRRWAWTGRHVGRRDERLAALGFVIG